MEKQTIFLKFEKDINSKVRKFWVQQLPEDQKQTAIEYFCKYFIRDEQMSKSLKIIQDENSMEYCKQFWWDVVNQNKSLACFTELDNGQNQMVAVNFCYHAFTHEKNTLDNKPEAIGIILDTLDYINKLRNITDELGITEYLGALGLVVLPEYRGFNIGHHVLLARKLLCKKLGLRASVTVFTSPASQRLAEKAGFKDIVSVTYDDLENMRPASKFPNIKEYSKYIRNMYVLY